MEVADRIREPRETLSMNPKKFTLWLFLVSIIMIFASQTSAYLVRRAEGNWLEFEIPQIFIYSTIVLIASSISMHWAYLCAKKDNSASLKIAISITFVLGTLFLAMQFVGWTDLVKENVYFVGNPSGSFFYVFTGLHGFHIISGLFVLIYCLIGVFNSKIHSKRLNRIEIASTYWHFLDILWIYLYVFLLIFH
jgi:cytochrome c oxidase subunit 3